MYNGYPLYYLKDYVINWTEIKQHVETSIVYDVKKKQDIIIIKLIITKWKGVLLCLESSFPSFASNFNFRIFGK